MLLFICLNLLISFLCCINFGLLLGSRGAKILTTYCCFLNLIFILFLINKVIHNPYIFELDCGTWIQSGLFSVNWIFFLDDFTLFMLFIVNFISFLVHMYSCSYMKEDPHIVRFMAYLSLFTFFMIILVTSDNFIQFFLGWEGVGLCSFLLISFWYTRIQAVKSALKAVIVNRVSDFCLTFGIVILFNIFKSMDFSLVFSLCYFFKNIYFTFGIFQVNIFDFMLIFFFFGAVGKSAQIILHTWLPDAMEGPTPVSALIHAATMVTAGVFLLIKCSSLFELSNNILGIICFSGAFTSFFSATCGLFLYDIKKVIAYSTCSQLGYMILACGLSFYNISFFHLMNHAIFKALLFLCAGSIIHSLNNEQDIRRMGGLLQVLPFAYIAFLIASLAITGFPFLTGFFSKDILIESIYGLYGSSGFFLHWLGCLAAFFTSFYSLRLIWFIFIGKTNSYRLVIANIHESDILILLPLFLLTVGSIFFGFFCKELIISIGHFLLNNNNFFLNKILFLNESEYLVVLFKSFPLIFTIFGSTTFLCLFFLFFWIGLVYNKTFRKLFLFLSAKWYFDAIYNGIFNEAFLKYAKNNIYLLIDKGLLEIMGSKGIWIGLLNSIQWLRTLQSGNISFYFIIWGITLCFSIFYINANNYIIFIWFWGLFYNSLSKWTVYRWLPTRFYHCSFFKTFDPFSSKDFYLDYNKTESLYFQFYKDMLKSLLSFWIFKLEYFRQFEYSSYIFILIAKFFADNRQLMDTEFDNSENNILDNLFKINDYDTHLFETTNATKQNTPILYNAFATHELTLQALISCFTISNNDYKAINYNIAFYGLWLYEDSIDDLFDDNMPNSIIKKATNSIEHLYCLFSAERLIQLTKYEKYYYRKYTSKLFDQPEYLDGYRSKLIGCEYLTQRYKFPSDYTWYARTHNFETQVLNNERYLSKSRLTQLYLREDSILNHKWTYANCFKDIGYQALFEFENIFNPALTNNLQASNLDNIYTFTNKFNNNWTVPLVLRLNQQTTGIIANTTVTATDSNAISTSESNFIFEQLSPLTGTETFAHNHYRMFYIDEWLRNQPWSDFYSMETILDSTCIENTQEDDFLIDENRLFETWKWMIIFKTSSIIADDLYYPDNGAFHFNHALDSTGLYTAFLSRGFNYGANYSYDTEIYGKYDSITVHNFTIFPIAIPFLFFDSIYYFRMGLTIWYIYDIIFNFSQAWLKFFIEFIVTLIYFILNYFIYYPYHSIKTNFEINARFKHCLYYLFFIQETLYHYYTIFIKCLVGLTYIFAYWYDINAVESFHTACNMTIGYFRTLYKNMYIMLSETILMDLMQSSVLASTCIDANLFEVTNGHGKIYYEALLEAYTDDVEFPTDWLTFRIEMFFEYIEERLADVDDQLTVDSLVSEQFLDVMAEHFERGDYWEGYGLISSLYNKLDIFEEDKQFWICFDVAHILEWERSYEHDDEPWYNQKTNYERCIFFIKRVRARKGEGFMEDLTFLIEGFMGGDDINRTLIDHIASETHSKSFTELKNDQVFNRTYEYFIDQQNFAKQKSEYHKELMKGVVKKDTDDINASDLFKDEDAYFMIEDDDLIDEFNVFTPNTLFYGASFLFDEFFWGLPLIIFPIFYLGELILNLVFFCIFYLGFCCIDIIFISFYDQAVTISYNVIEYCIPTIIYDKFIWLLFDVPSEGDWFVVWCQGVDLLWPPFMWSAIIIWVLHFLNWIYLSVTIECKNYILKQILSKIILFIITIFIFIFLCLFINYLLLIWITHLEMDTFIYPKHELIITFKGIDYLIEEYNYNFEPRLVDDKSDYPFQKSGGPGMTTQTRQGVRALWYRRMTRGNIWYWWWEPPYYKSTGRFFWNTQFRRNRPELHTNQYPRVYNNNLYENTTDVTVNLTNFFKNWLGFWKMFDAI